MLSDNTYLFYLKTLVKNTFQGYAVPIDGEIRYHWWMHLLGYPLQRNHNQEKSYRVRLMRSNPFSKDRFHSELVEVDTAQPIPCKRWWHYIGMLLYIVALSMPRKLIQNSIRLAEIALGFCEITLDEIGRKINSVNHWFTANDTGFPKLIEKMGKASPWWTPLVPIVALVAVAVSVAGYLFGGCWTVASAVFGTARFIVQRISSPIRSLQESVEAGNRFAGLTIKTKKAVQQKQDLKEQAAKTPTVLAQSITSTQSAEIKPATEEDESAERDTKESATSESISPETATEKESAATSKPHEEIKSLASTKIDDALDDDHDETELAAKWPGRLLGSLSVLISVAGYAAIGLAALPALPSSVGALLPTKFSSLGGSIVAWFVNLNELGTAVIIPCVITYYCRKIVYVDHKEWTTRVATLHHNLKALEQKILPESLTMQQIAHHWIKIRKTIIKKLQDLRYKLKSIFDPNSPLMKPLLKAINKLLRQLRNLSDTTKWQISETDLAPYQDSTAALLSTLRQEIGEPKTTDANKKIFEEVRDYVESQNLAISSCLSALEAPFIGSTGKEISAFFRHVETATAAEPKEWDMNKYLDELNARDAAAAAITPPPATTTVAPAPTTTHPDEPPDPSLESDAFWYCPSSITP